MGGSRPLFSTSGFAEFKRGPKRPSKLTYGYGCDHSHSQLDTESYVLGFRGENGGVLTVQVEAPT